VDSCIELLIGHIMTHSTVDLFQLLRMGKLFNGCILVAIDTLHSLVHRTPKTLEIHIEGYCATTSLCGQFSVGVAGLTIFVALRLSKTRKKNKA
jgi:hypothetical protein